MAPIGDELAQKLVDSIDRLESRIKRLEDDIRHTKNDTQPKGDEGVRMVLMGPPGAGM